MPKRNKESDFKKVKQKVGQKKIDPKATNVNVRMKRIRVQEQSIMREDQEMVNYRNKSLADLVGQFTHYNAGVRREAILGLCDLFSQNEILYSTSLNILITKTIPLLLDTDISVRQAVVSIYESMLVNVPRQSLLPFSGIISLFVNNGLTSINPSIRRSSLLMVQTLLDIEPRLFAEASVKILSSMIKLATEVKTTSLPSRGVLSTNRSQMKANSKEQRPITELALETIQSFYSKCFSNQTVYNAMNHLSGNFNSEEDEIISFHNQNCTIDLTLHIASSTSFFSSSSNSTPQLFIDSLQLFLSNLFTQLSEVIPQEDQPVSSLHQLLHDSKEKEVHSKSIKEKDLKKVDLLLDLVMNSYLLLENEKVLKLREKSENDWCVLLRDFYPLRLPDSHRNEISLRLLVQKVNSLLICLLALFTKSHNKTYQLIEYDLKQDSVYITSQRKQQEEKGYEILPETVLLKVNTLYRLWFINEEKEDVLERSIHIWNELIEKGFASLSLPFIQFYLFILNQDLLIDYSSCLSCIIRTLQACPFSIDRQGIQQLWKVGLKLILGIVKLSSEIDQTIQSEFEQLVLNKVNNQSVYSLLSSELQSIVLAILSYCNSLSSQVIEEIPQIQSINQFRS